MTAPSRAELDAGLQRLLSDVPVRSGYLELGVGYDSSQGAWARSELGAHLLPNLGAFAFAQASTVTGVSAGLGARLNFNLF